MLTRLVVRNFKRFENLDIALGNPVVFIGPNNSGKTSALQALSLWNLGLRRWREKYPGRTDAGKRPGVVINRRDILDVPVPTTNLLWHDLRLRNVQQKGQKRQLSNIRIDVVVEGVGKRDTWRCGLEFDYANEEVLYCRPLRLDERGDCRMSVPLEAGSVSFTFVPPMAGLISDEPRLLPGAVNVRMGEGRTAEVLRNLCYRLYTDYEDRWSALVTQIESLFGVRVESPRYVPDRGEIAMTYREGGIRLDLASGGRGFHQTLLLLAGLHTNPGAVLLLDEPDAHLEILRQRQVYNLLQETANEAGSQVIAASHSETVLNEAAGKDMVIAFVGEPHRLDDRGSRPHQALREIGFEHYAQAKSKGWVLYLKDSTELSILRQFARRLGHEEAIEALEQPFCHYIGNDVRAARRHYYGLAEAMPDIKGLAILARLERDPALNHLKEMTWQRREIENYLCSRETLRVFARETAQVEAFGPLFMDSEVTTRVRAMERAIDQIEGAMASLEKGSPWDHDTKVSDDFLKPLFSTYYKLVGLPNLMRKRSFHELAEYVPDHEIDPEIGKKLDAIADLAAKAQPA